MNDQPLVAGVMAFFLCSLTGMTAVMGWVVLRYAWTHADEKGKRNIALGILFVLTCGLLGGVWSYFHP